MPKRSPLFFLALTGVLASFFAPSASIPASAMESQATEYMLELGATFYRMGKYDEALHEFKKVLLIDPANRSAQKYVNDIFAKDAVAPAAPAAAPIAEALPPAPAAVKPPAPEPPKAVTPAEPPQAALREKAMEQALREKGPPAAPVKE